jgi:hypothetical protein
VRGLAPREARLQLARRPLMTGVASSHAFLAASASLNVTCRSCCIRRQKNGTHSAVQLGKEGKEKKEC